jgi:hypothetical protein
MLEDEIAEDLDLIRMGAVLDLDGHPMVDKNSAEGANGGGMDDDELGAGLVEYGRGRRRGDGSESGSVG